MENQRVPCVFVVVHRELGSLNKTESVTYTARVNSCTGQSAVDAAVRRALVLGHPFPELLLHLVGVQVELVHFGG